MSLIAVVAALGDGARMVAEPEPDVWERATADVAPAVDAVAGPGQTWVVRPLGLSHWEASHGLLAHMARRGAQVKVPERFRIHAGPTRVLGPDDPADAADGTLVVATGLSAVALRDDPRVEALATSDPLTADERAELVGLQASAQQAMIDAGRPELRRTVELGELAALVGTGPAWIAVTPSASTSWSLAVRSSPSTAPPGRRRTSRWATTRCRTQSRGPEV